MGGSQGSIERVFFGAGSQLAKSSARNQSEGEGRSRFKSSALYNAGAAAIQ